jgi:Fe-Mn family superoxide dismutase
MAYEVPALPYDYNALEPHVDEATMRVHHDKHHQAYVDKANAALEGTGHEGKPVEEVLRRLDSLPADKQGPFRNNGGGHFNHSLFWEAMSPDGGGEPTGELATAISSTFGSFDAFKEQFEAAGVARFGSGWVWLVLDGGELKITSTANQDSPSSRARSRCSATTSGSTPTTCSTRTSARTTSRRGGTSSTGQGGRAVLGRAGLAAAPALRPPR